MIRFIPSLTILCVTSAVFCSCGTMDTLKTGASKVGDGFGKLADATTSPFRPGLPVVEAREADMREMKSGQEQALAYQAKQQQRRSWWNFEGSSNFEEPDLPELGEPMDAGLLPDKID